MKRRWLAANWKMNLPDEGIDAYAAAVGEWPRHSAVELILIPPFPFLGRLIEIASGTFRVGAQNCSAERAGAFTGEVSAPMVRQVGATHVLVGHSERRYQFDEDDRVVGRKLGMTRDAGLIPILCVGEEESVRASGQTEALVKRQLETALQVAGPVEEILVAYEPVWAIGTGRHATPGMVAETHGRIREMLEQLIGTDVPILYGGSVSPENAEELARAEGVDGFLVGGASLDSAKFHAIYDALGS